MKVSIKFLAIIAMVLALNFSATAQRGERGERGAKKADPTEMAEKQTTKMVKKLSLDDVQAAKVKALNLTYAQKLHEAKEENKGNRAAMKEIGAAINAEKTAEMKLVLSEEQFKEYETMAKKKGKRKGGKKGRRSKR